MDINDDQEVNALLTKNKLNELCVELYDKAIKLVDRGLNTARIKANQITFVVFWLS